MAEYIEKSKLIDYFKDTYGGGIEENICVWYQDIIRDIEETPTVKFTPVVYARWVKIYDEGEPAIKQPIIGVFCSKCLEPPKDKFTESKFCPNCGAKMKVNKT